MSQLKKIKLPGSPDHTYLGVAQLRLALTASTFPLSHGELCLYFLQLSSFLSSHQLERGVTVTKAEVGLLVKQIFKSDPPKLGSITSHS